jgi:hypothetical protein
MPALPTRTARIVVIVALGGVRLVVANTLITSSTTSAATTAPIAAAASRLCRASASMFGCCYFVVIVVVNVALVVLHSPDACGSRGRNWRRTWRRHPGEHLAAPKHSKNQCRSRSCRKPLERSTCGRAEQLTQECGCRGYFAVFVAGRGHARVVHDIALSANNVDQTPRHVRATCWVEGLHQLADRRCARVACIGPEPLHSCPKLIYRLGWALPHCRPLTLSVDNCVGTSRLNLQRVLNSEVLVDQCHSLCHLKAIGTSTLHSGLHS